MIIITFCFLGFGCGFGGSSSLLDEDVEDEVVDEEDDEVEPVSSSDPFLSSSAPIKT